MSASTEQSRFSNGSRLDSDELDSPFGAERAVLLRRGGEGVAQGEPNRHHPAQQMP